MNNGVEVLDMKSAKSFYKPTGEAKQHTRKSVPSEAVYQKRFKWWRDMGFSEEAAKWAAARRLGKPLRIRGVTDAMVKTYNNAIRAAEKRKSMLDRRLYKFPNKTREEHIKDLDTDLKRIDLEHKIERSILPPGTSLDSRYVEPNIFLMGSL